MTLKKFHMPLSEAQHKLTVKNVCNSKYW